MKPDCEKQTPPRMPQTLNSAEPFFLIVASDSSRKLAPCNLAAHARLIGSHLQAPPLPQGMGPKACQGALLVVPPPSAPYTFIPNYTKARSADSQPQSIGHAESSREAALCLSTRSNGLELIGGEVSTIPSFCRTPAVFCEAHRLADEPFDQAKRWDDTKSLC
jgi:hypothetical protein